MPGKIMCALRFENVADNEHLLFVKQTESPLVQDFTFG